MLIPTRRDGSRLDPLNLGLAAGYNAVCPERVPSRRARGLSSRLRFEPQLDSGQEVTREGDASEAGTNLMDQPDLEAVAAGTAKALLDVPLDHAGVVGGEFAIDVIVQPSEDRLAGRLHFALAHAACLLPRGWPARTVVR